MYFTEIRSGDIRARAGLVVNDGNHLMAGQPSPSSRWPITKLDIPKGHIHNNETPILASIRECDEEFGLLFESWKLDRPKQFMMEGEALFLWEVRLTELPPIEMLFCASTFIDDITKQRRPEMAGYRYISLYHAKHYGAFSNLQDRLRPCVEAYFKDDFIYPFKDQRICADKLNLPDGLYKGLHTAYFITLENGITFKTILGVKGRNIPITVAVRNGLVYKGIRL